METSNETMYRAGFNLKNESNWPHWRQGILSGTFSNCLLIVRTWLNKAENTTFPPSFTKQPWSQLLPFKALIRAPNTAGLWHHRGGLQQLPAQSWTIHSPLLSMRGPILSVHSLLLLLLCAKHMPELQYSCILLFLPNVVWHALLLNLCPAACEGIVGSDSRPDREAELIKRWTVLGLL